jgi:hypothetical protein
LDYGLRVMRIADLADAVVQKMGKRAQTKNANELE